MSIQINRMTNANIILNGVSLLGQAEEVSSPTIKAIMSEYKALGMQSKREMFSGIDKVEMKVKWNSIYPDTAALLYDMTTSVDLQIRGSLETHENGGRVAEVPAVFYVRCSPKDIKIPDFKQNDNVETESNFNCSYVKVEIDGRELLEWDADAQIYRVDGEDKNSNYRANLGI